MVSKQLIACLLTAMLAAALGALKSEPAYADGIAAVSAGYNHTCAVTTGGGVKCWGDNTYGQLGNGTITSTTSPVDVTSLTSGIAGVSAGGGYTCALTTTGAIECWGNNSSGQLGNGANTNSSTPEDVSGLTSGVIAVSAGYGHACALTAAGGLKCWGDNADRQLGNGTTTNSSTPMDVSGLTTGVAAVSAGLNHTCALTISGGVKCWGENAFGQLGDGTTTDRSTPVDVSGLTSGMAAVETGNSFSCALTTSGGVKCWGANLAGELGDGKACGSNSCLTPVDVLGLPSGVSAVSARSSAHICAFTLAGDVKCWGFNAYGQLGNGTYTGPEMCLIYGCSTTPVDVGGLSGVSAISAGGDHTCALTSTGNLKCWGRNSHGELGVGTNTGPELCYSVCSTTPADVSPAAKAAPPTPTPTPTLTPPPIGGISLDPPQPSASGRSVALPFAALALVGASCTARAIWLARRRRLRYR